MVKTTLYIPDAMKRGIERISRDRGITEAEFIRQSLAGAVVAAQPRPRGGFIESVDPGPPIDWNSNDHLAGFGER